jgi:hypothetical protein
MQFTSFTSTKVQILTRLALSVEQLLQPRRASLRRAAVAGSLSCSLALARALTPLARSLACSVARSLSMYNSLSLSLSFSPFLSLGGGPACSDVPDSAAEAAAAAAGPSGGAEASRRMLTYADVR